MEQTVSLAKRLTELVESVSPEERRILLAVFELASVGDESAEVEGFVQRRGFGAGSASISQGAELDMIRLQSMVSERQQAIQLCTQMMQTMNDSTGSVIKNVR